MNVKIKATETFDYRSMRFVEGSIYTCLTLAEAEHLPVQVIEPEPEPVESGYSEYTTQDHEGDE